MPFQLTQAPPRSTSHRFLPVSESPAPRQQWRGLIETQDHSKHQAVAEAKAPRQQWRGLIETNIPTVFREDVEWGSTSAMAWPH